MTPDQIKEAAIEAAMKAAHAVSGTHSGREIAWEDEEIWAKLEWKEEITAAIQAYEAALWRPIEEAPQYTPILTNCKHGLIEGEYSPEPDGVVEGYYFREMSWYATRFRPLPQPPEVKHEPA